MRKLVVILVASLSFLGMSSAFAGLIPNGSFETGNTAGWNTNNGKTSVVTSYVVSDGLFNPPVTMTATDGDFFAVLKANRPATRMWTNLSVGVGDILSFNSFFGANDIFNDRSAFWLELESDGSTMYSGPLGSVGSVGWFGNSGWETNSFVMTDSGDVTLTFAIHDAYNPFEKCGCDFSSVLGVDGVMLTSTSVSEPGSIALAGLGLLGLGAVRRRNKMK